jgi:Lon protease-like protein
MSDVNPIPLFPLPLVLFPGEDIPLHIFEPRYKEMIAECLRDGHPFGIVSYLNNKVSTVGCTCEIAQVRTTYDDGRYDIIGRGVDRFLIHGFITKRAFIQGSVSYFHDVIEDEHTTVIDGLLEQIEPLFNEILHLAKQEVTIHPVATPTRSFDFGHYVGFELSQKQNLLEIKSEYERLVFIKHHLEHILPKLRAFEETRHKIKQNGHFREFPPIYFKTDN